MQSSWTQTHYAEAKLLYKQNTTSDYGHDSYEFAKDKPLKLLNGGHLLALLHKNGRNAHINIEEAKKIIDNRSAQR